MYDFAMNNDVDRINPDLPHYQNIINQVRRILTIVVHGLAT